MNEGQKRLVICSLIILNCSDYYKHKIVILVIRYICSSESKVDSCFCAKQLRIYLIRLLLVVKLRVKQAWPLSYINSEPPTMDCCHCGVCNSEISFLTYFSVVCIGTRPSGALDHFMSFLCHKAALTPSQAAKEGSLQPRGIHKWLTTTEQLCCLFSFCSQHRRCTSFALSSYKQLLEFIFFRLLYMME